MEFHFSPKVKDLQERVTAFMEEHIYPSESKYQEHCEGPNRWQPVPVIEDLKLKARAARLWNLFLPASEHGAGLTNLEYAPLCEIMGRSPLDLELFNCSAPDTGNMEVLARYGTVDQQERWLEPLLEGLIRFCSAMTESAVASSDATNIESAIIRDGDEYVINGRKWYTTSDTDPRCKICIFMGKTDPDNTDRHKQQSMILVPTDAPGVKVLRPLPVIGSGLRSPFRKRARSCVQHAFRRRSRQGHPGLGRIHQWMRLIGLAERSLEKMCIRTSSRLAFGKLVSEQTVTQERIVEARIMIDQARLLTLNAAEMMDTVGNRKARTEIAMIKVADPEMACQVVRSRLGDPSPRWGRH
jgi:acyl-CoA dehydrogenase